MLDEAEAQLPDAHNLVLPSRILHLPMAFEERWTRDAIDKYMKSTRAEVRGGVVTGAGALCVRVA